MSVVDAFSLSGKVSVVTGANRGIGRALVTALAEAGTTSCCSSEIPAEQMRSSRGWMRSGRPRSR